MPSLLLVTKDAHLREIVCDGFGRRGWQVEAADEMAVAASTLSCDCVLWDAFCDPGSFTELWQRRCPDDRPVTFRLAADGAGAAPSHDSAAVAVLPGGLTADHLVQWIELAVECRDLRRRLQECEKVSMLGNVIAGVLHELKNPVNNLLGALDRLLLQVGTEPSIARWSDIVRRNGELVRESLNDLLGGLRTNKSLEPVAVHERLHRAADYVMKGTVDLRRIEVKRELTATYDVILGCPAQCLHLFLNLVVNARQAIGEQPGAITLRSRNEDGGLIVEVEDTGPGIPADVLAHLFEPFHSTKPGGSGIGLTFARRIAESFGGTLSAENLPHGGARFTVRLRCHSTP